MISWLHMHTRHWFLLALAAFLAATIADHATIAYAALVATVGAGIATVTGDHWRHLAGPWIVIYAIPSVALAAIAPGTFWNVAPVVPYVAFLAGGFHAYGQGVDAGVRMVVRAHAEAVAEMTEATEVANAVSDDPVAVRERRDRASWN